MRPGEAEPTLCQPKRKLMKRNVGIGLIFGGEKMKTTDEIKNKKNYHSQSFSRKNYLESKKCEESNKICYLLLKKKLF